MIIFLTGVIGNVIVCVVIVRHHTMHTATNYYLFSLAISDLMFLLMGKSILFPADDEEGRKLQEETNSPGACTRTIRFWGNVEFSFEENIVSVLLNSSFPTPLMKLSGDRSELQNCVPCTRFLPFIVCHLQHHSPREAISTRTCSSSSLLLKDSPECSAHLVAAA